MYHLIDYVWCVEKFAQYFEPHEQEVYPLLTSPIFAYKNTRWVLNLYPEGLGDSASQGYISLFIKYVSEDPETINAKVELSLLNNKNERVYCRDTGDHQYQTFIDFGYKQFLKIQDIKDQKEDLIFNGQLKIFARVEFEHGTLPSSLTWSNYDLLLFKENFKDLYETKNLCDIVIKVVKKPLNNQQSLPCRNSQINNSTAQNTFTQYSNSLNSSPIQSKNSNHYHPYTVNSTGSSLSTNNHCLKLKRPGTNSNKSTNHSYLSDSNGVSNLDNSTPPPTMQNTSLCDFIMSSSLAQLNQSSSSNVYFKEGLNLTNDYDYNSILFNKLTKQTDLNINNNNNTNRDFEVLDIKAHKFILASRSGKFRELLKTNLIKLCTLNNVPLACEECLKESSLIESNKLTGGCSSINCLYKSENQLSDVNNNKNNNQNNNSHNNLNNNTTSLTSNNNAGSSMTSSGVESADTKPVSEILCSSSYPSCSTSSSSSSSNDQEPCTCNSEQKLKSNVSSQPSSSYMSSSSNAGHPVACRTGLHCTHEPFKLHDKLLLTEDPDITDLLIIETDRSPKVIEYLIRYMYTGYLDSLDSFSKDIYEISKEYKVHGLTNLAREHIIKELNIQNCCDYLVFCVINNDYELNNKIQTFIADNYDTIIKTNAYKQAKRKYRELFENTFNEIFKKIPTLNKSHY